MPFAIADVTSLTELGLCVGDVEICFKINAGGRLCDIEGRRGIILLMRLIGTKSEISYYNKRCQWRIALLKILEGTAGVPLQGGRSAHIRVCE